MGTLQKAKQNLIKARDKRIQLYNKLGGTDYFEDCNKVIDIIDRLIREQKLERIMKNLQ